MPDLASAVEAVRDGRSPTAPVSVTLPRDLVDAVKALVAEGEVPSLSGVLSQSLTAWAANRLLREDLDALYAEQPDLQPSEESVAAAAAELGLPAA